MDESNNSSNNQNDSVENNEEYSNNNNIENESNMNESESHIENESLYSYDENKDFPVFANKINKKLNDIILHYKQECKNPEKSKKTEEKMEEKDYNSEEDEQFNDANFIKSMKEGKYRDKHFRRFSKNNDGVEFTAFDLREENEEGHFDKNMNYDYSPDYPEGEEVNEEYEKRIEEYNYEN